MDDAISSISLPDDPQALKSMIVALQIQRDEVARKAQQLARDRDEWKLKHDYKEIEGRVLFFQLRLNKWYYGSKW